MLDEIRAVDELVDGAHAHRDPAKLFALDRAQQRIGEPLRTASPCRAGKSIARGAGSMGPVTLQRVVHLSEHAIEPREVRLQRRVVRRIQGRGEKRPHPGCAGKLRERRSQPLVVGRVSAVPSGSRASSRPGRSGRRRPSSPACPPPRRTGPTNASSCDRRCHWQAIR